MGGGAIVVIGLFLGMGPRVHNQKDLREIYRRKAKQQRVSSSLCRDAEETTREIPRNLGGGWDVHLLG